MFKVNIREHENTMEELRELENTMKIEREKQLEAIENMTYGWYGVTAMTVKNMFPQMLNQGLYDRTYRQTCDMRKTMEEALPELKALKSQIEKSIYGRFFNRQDLCYAQTCGLSKHGGLVV